MEGGGEVSYVTPNEKPDPRTDRPTPEETPLTEAHLFGARGGDCVTEVKAVVRANFARRLERENTALRARAERLAEALSQMLLYFGSPKRDEWNSPQSFTQAKNTEANAMQALTFYRAETPKL